MAAVRGASMSDQAWASVPRTARQEFQKWYGANSAGDGKLPELWVRGASLLIPRLSTLARGLSLPKRKQRRAKRGLRHCKWHEFNTTGTMELKYLFDAYGSDKGFDTHSLHHAYAHIIERLGGRSAPLRLLEVGLGSRNQRVVSAMASTAKPPGASLRRCVIFTGLGH